MDKSTKRQIGYIKPVVIEKDLTMKAPKSNHTINTVGVGVKKADPLSVKPKGSTPESIIKWLKDHPLFKWATMCSEIGLDPGNFCRTMEKENPVIKPEVILKIEKVISHYGYKK